MQKETAKRLLVGQRVVFRNVDANEIVTVVRVVTEINGPHVEVETRRANGEVCVVFPTYLALMPGGQI